MCTNTGEDSHKCVYIDHSSTFNLNLTSLSHLIYIYHCVSPSAWFSTSDSDAIRACSFALQSARPLSKVCSSTPSWTRQNVTPKERCTCKIYCTRRCPLKTNLISQLLYSDAHRQRTTGEKLGKSATLTDDSTNPVWRHVPFENTEARSSGVVVESA